MNTLATTVQDPQARQRHADFTVGFDPRDRQRVLESWDDVLRNHVWTEG